MTWLAAFVVVATACTPQQIAAAVLQHNADLAAVAQHNADLACAKATKVSDAAHNAADAAVAAADSASGDLRGDADAAVAVTFRDAAVADDAAANACSG